MVDRFADLQKSINIRQNLGMMGRKMGRLNLSIEDRVEAKFREEVFRRKGMKKGNLTKAIEEAMVMWIDRGKITEPTKSQ